MAKFDIWRDLTNGKIWHFFFSYDIDWSPKRNVPSSLNNSDSSNSSAHANDHPRMVTLGSRDRQTDPPKFQTQFQNDDSSSEKGSSNGDFGFEWDTSDFSRNISNAHLDQSEDAPIPIISPLETAQAPLELLVDTGKPKVDHIEYLTRCETPPPTQIEDFNKSFVS